VLGLSLPVGADRLVFSHTSDELCDLLAEPTLNLDDVRVGVLDHVVQERRGDDLLGESSLVKQGGDRDRMLDLGIAVASGAMMGPEGGGVGASQKRPVADVSPAATPVPGRR
jgi:hypothetical protein